MKHNLSEIRNTLLGLKVIFVELDDEDDAYTIFETLNTRGKDLALADLVKNHFTRLLKPTNKGVDQSKEKWQKLMETIEGSKFDITTDTFIHHYWLSKYEYITAKSLFKSFRKGIKRSNSKTELNFMLSDAEIYRSLYDIPYGQWTNQQRKISGALSALMLFRVRQQIPCTLSLVRSFRQDVIKKRSLESALVSIENFHFQFTAITSQRSSGGISGMYALLARRINSAKSSQDANTIIQELRKKLKERITSEEEFVALFPELLYTNRLSKQRALVKYVLVRLARHAKDAYPGDLSDMTIEHIFPQSDIDDDVFTEEVVGQMGNLLLVSDDLNQKLKDKSFKQKKSILVKEGYPISGILSKVKEWNPLIIRQRTEEIALKAYREVWKI